jgi:hypothetical protein
MAEMHVILAGIRLVHPIYDACARLYEDFKHARDFGRDFTKAKNILECQYARLYQTGRVDLHELQNPLDPEDEFHQTTKAVIGLLVEIRVIFEKCNDLVEKYNRKGRSLKP